MSHTTRPAKITDLSATLYGSTMSVSWTTPTNAVKFHIVWSTIPISEALTIATTKANWWSANAVGTSLTATPGSRQTQTFSVSGASTYYVAMFSWDSTWNMSPMSNVATSSPGSTLGTSSTTAKATTTSASTTAKSTTGASTTAKATTTSASTTAKSTTGTSTAKSTTGTTTAKATTSTTGSANGVFYINPGDNYVSIINALQPGQTAIFRAGTYYLSGKFSTVLNGGYGQLITIKGDDNQSIKLVRNDTAQNIWDISGSYLVIQNLEFQGGSRGLRFGESSDCHDITVQNVRIHNTQSHGITMNEDGRSYYNNILTNNQIYNIAGNCVVMGCTAVGSCTVSNSNITYSLCSNTLAAANGYGHGVTIQPGSNWITVRGNSIWDTAGVGILLYDDYDNGINVVDGNFIHSARDSCIQVTAGASITNNIAYNCTNHGIHGTSAGVLSGSYPRNIDIDYNTIVRPLAGSCIKGESWDSGADSIGVANNALFGESRPVFSITATLVNGNVFDNAYNGSSSTINGVGQYGAYPVGTAAVELVNVAGLNFYPKSTSLLLAQGIWNVPVTDFNCLARSSPSTIGAYEYKGPTNTGWVPTRGIKTCASGGIVNPSAEADDSGMVSSGNKVEILFVVLAILMIFAF